MFTVGVGCVLGGLRGTGWEGFVHGHEFPNVINLLLLTCHFSLF